MGHITSKNAYKSLEERINWFTQGAPASETFYKILQVLFTEKEAKVMAMLPVRPFTVKRAARIWNTSEAKAEKVLDHLCEKALLVDSSYEGVRRFVIPPPMAGFIEFALMRTRGDIDQKYLAELYYQYMNVEEDFVKDLFYATETKLGRVYVQEPVLTNEHMNHILITRELRILLRKQNTSVLDCVTAVTKRTMQAIPVRSTRPGMCV